MVCHFVQVQIRALRRPKAAVAIRSNGRDEFDEFVVDAEVEEDVQGDEVGQRGGHAERGDGLGSRNDHTTASAASTSKAWPSPMGQSAPTARSAPIRRIVAASKAISQPRDEERSRREVTSAYGLWP